MKSFLSKKRIAMLTVCVLSSIAALGEAVATAEKIEAYEGEEYVVTATRTPLEEKKVPMAVEVLSREKLDEMGAYSVQDALRYSLGLNVMDEGMTGNVVQIRGMRTEHALILVDGKRLTSENTASTMNVYELNRINMADVERIEIIRGSGSALYGSDALGGVINIITKKASKEGGSVHVYTGGKRSGTEFSYATGKMGKLSAKISGGIEKVRTQTTSYYSESAGGIYKTTNMAGPRRYLGVNLDYDLGHNRSLAFDANFMREQLTTKTNTAGELAKYAYDNNRSDYALAFSGKDDRNDYLLRAYYGNFKKYNDTIEAGAYSDWDNSEYETFVVEGKDSWTIDKHNRLTFGAEFKQTSMAGTRIGGGADNPFVETKFGIEKSGSEKSTDSASVYLQDEWQVNDKLLIIPAVRYDNYESFGGKASPKVGLTYSFSDNSRFKANYGKAFRAPTVYELYATMEKVMGGMMVQVLGNPDLKPEESKNFDVSFEAEKGKFNAKATYFYNKMTNMLDSEMLGVSYDRNLGRLIISSKYVNVEKATIQGTELELGYNFNKHWNLKATHSYLDARDDINNKRLSSRARQTGTVQLAYTDAKPHPLTATLWNQYYIDYKYDNNIFYTFSTTNFILDKKIGKNISIYAGVDNIFDKKFDLDDDRSFSIDGRFWRVGAQYTF